VLGSEGRRIVSSRRAPRARAAAAVGALGVLAGAAAACSGSTTSSVPPTTGILIRAETLTGGKGCGPGPSQIYRYAVIVFGYGAGDPAEPASYDAPVTSNVFDCYTDGPFISLPSKDGNTTFRLEVFAYDRAAYEAARSVVDAAGDADTGRLPGYSAELKETKPTWTTECSATQLENVEALASCRPLAAGASGVGGALAPTTITLDTSKITLPDGRTGSCDAGDAGAPEAGDAGARLAFAQVRVRTRQGAQILADTTVPCPAPYTVEVPPQPATYTLDVGLLDGAGNLVDPAAVAECTAASVTGSTSSAVCR
jgi:hypothetical protein